MSSSGLPQHSAVQEKAHRSQGSWTKPVLVPIPGVKARRLRILVPVTSQFQRFGASKLARKRGPILICFACMAVVFTVLLVTRNMGERDWREPWPQSVMGDPSTLVFKRADLQKIWKWEIDSGHYPSRASIPKEIGFKLSPVNPAVPSRRRPSPSKYRPPPELGTIIDDTDTIGSGPKRVYLDIQTTPPNVAYPPRPVPGSVADMDIIMKYCDFSQNKYVRDCLEVLRLGGGLDNGQRLRRGAMDDWKYIYLEQRDGSSSTPDSAEDLLQQKPIYRPVKKEIDPNAGLVKKPDSNWEPTISLPATIDPIPHLPPSSACDPENPRLFHMFWTGPFTDKPYLALMSFLYTQNTGIHLETPDSSTLCRPQFWMWINPGPAAAVPNPNALGDMFEQLKVSPWASPFLHPRFKDVIKFKMWNTTEQLDGIPEIKDEWRALQESLFNSGGHIISVPKKASSTSSANSTSSTAAADDDVTNRMGSKSSSSYDRLSVILSDMARFVLCHRFGGIYLDADTIFLRDWEELWGWKGAFAYRWSRLPNYNTAVLRMNKGSALGTFLFRTALKNGLDFHPMTVTRYMADAHLNGLLLRLPDALFDSAWLNTEWYQRDRPPQPYFTEFADFFETPAQNSAAPQALGFDGFFKGAYSYHFHNFWWKPFDATRNWPDLGPRFIAGERRARAALATPTGSARLSTETANATEVAEDKAEEDKRDLDWSAVMKRTFESYIRSEIPNLYGEWIKW